MIEVRKCARNFNNSGASSPVVKVWITHTLCVSYFCTLEAFLVPVNI